MSVEFGMEGAVATITLNRPERMNALTMEMRAELSGHLRRVRDDDAIRAAILTGAGAHFCAGADVGRMGDDRSLRAGRQRMQRGSHTVVRLLHAIEKPVIAAVHGVAVGVGWSYALACDVVIASDEARFGATFRRIGLAPDGGLAWFLARRAGPGRGKELAFSGRVIGAAEAAGFNLVEEVVPAGDLAARAAALAAEYAAGPSFAMGLAKRMFDRAVGPGLDEFLDYESLIQPQLHETRDHREGVAAFKEKRKPDFTGM
ncbi:MAG: enoyl-CoA hydratase/isomerase family protein [Rhodospirillales bacterium]|nr:enoyl-CoA hydratase/isomerase family protein [Rhodospirillales bacterium]